MQESLKQIEIESENFRYGQQMMKSSFENMKQLDMNIKQVKDDDFLMVNDSIDTTLQLKQYSQLDKNSSGEGRYQFNITPEQNYDDQKTYDQLCPAFSLQHILSNKLISQTNELDVNGNIQINLNNSQQPSSLLLNRSLLSETRGNLLNIRSQARTLVCDTNLRKFSDDLETKSGLTALMYHKSHSNNKNDNCSLHTPMMQQSIISRSRRPSKYSYFFRVVVFASKLIHKNSSIRFKKLTPHQFGIIDDFSSDYGYYIYQNPHIFSQVTNLKLCGQFTQFFYIQQLTINSFNFIIGKNFSQEIPLSSQKKDLFVMIMFYLSKSQEQDSIIKYFNYIIFIKYGDIPSKINEIENKLQISYSKQNWIKLFKLEILVLLIAHVACCIFLRIGISEQELGINSWLTRFEYGDLKITQKYVLSLYYMVVTMTTIGYGDVYPITLYEKGFIIIVALIATNVCAYSFSQISEIVKYEQLKKSNFDTMMQGINNEMNKRGLNILLQHKVRKYFEYQHFQNQQKQQTTSNLIDNLPAQMKEEVLLEVNSDQFSQECQKQISLCVKQKIVYPGDIIYREKEHCDCIYYIAQGSVNLQISVKTKNKKNETLQVKNLVTLRKKDVFGYESFLLNQLNPYTAKSNDISVLSYIEKSDLLQILNQFPLDYVTHLINKKKNLIFYFYLKEKLIFIKDKAILSKQLRQFNSSCISCGQKNHHFQSCPVVNPQIKLKPSYFDNQGILNRIKMVRKRVSYYNPLRDKTEITRKAELAAAQNQEQTIMSDIISLLNESNSSENDDQSDEQKEQLSSDILDEEEENKLESKKLQKQQKSILFQRNQKQNSLKEFKNALARMSEDSISFNTTPNSSTQNELAVQILNSNPVSFKKLKSNDLDIIEEKEEETPIIPIQKRRLVLTNPIFQGLSENKQLENKQQETKNIENKLQDVEEQINESMIEHDKGSNEQNILASFRLRNRSISQQSFRSLENLMTNSQNNFTPRANVAPPFQSNFRAQIRDKDKDDLISLKSRPQNQQLLISQKLDNSQENESIILERNANLIQPSQVDIEFKIGGSDSHKVISIPKINLIDGDDEEENCKEIINEINSQKKKKRKTQDNISPCLSDKKFKPIRKIELGQQFDLHKFCNKSNTVSLNQITSLDDLGSTPSKSREIHKKSSFEYMQDNSIQGSQYSDASNLYQKKQQQAKLTSSLNSKKEKTRQKSHSHILESDQSSHNYKKQNSIKVQQHQHRKSIIIDPNLQLFLAKQQKEFQSKQNNQNKKKADSGQASQNNLPPSNEYETTRQNQILTNPFTEGNQNTTEFQIRYQTNLQELDLLVVRKNFLLEQQQGHIQNFILVDDNEMDIDQMCDYVSYFPDHNLKEVLKRYRRTYKKSNTKGKSPLKILNKQMRSKRFADKSIQNIQTIRSNLRNTLTCMNSVSLERFSLKN